jgi:glycerophosphoryl diester phosphodiesterase
MTHVIAHRGLRNEKPENSIDAISAALRLPDLHGVEFDVELTRDHQSVVLHQETLVPNHDFTAVELASRNFVSRDWVVETLAKDVVAMDAGSWMDARFSNIKVPALSDVLRLSWGQVTAYVELKDATYWGKRDGSRPEQVVDSALPHLTAFPGPLDVISFNPEILRVLQRRAPRIPTTLALWTEWNSRIDDALAEATGCGAATISLPDTMIFDEPQWVKVAHEHGLRIHAYPVSPARGEPEFLSWTPETQSQKWRRLHQFGVDAILSDFARETLEALKRT